MPVVSETHQRLVSHLGAKPSIRKAAGVPAKPRTASRGQLLQRPGGINAKPKTRT